MSTSGSTTARPLPTATVLSWIAPTCSRAPAGRTWSSLARVLTAASLTPATVPPAARRRQTATATASSSSRSSGGSEPPDPSW